MPDLWRCTDFLISILTWGYELAGECDEFSATVSESRNGKYDFYIHWDHDLPKIMNYEFWLDDELQPPRWAFAFQWLNIKEVNY